MKIIVIILFLLVSSQLMAKDFKRRCSFKYTNEPSCFHARDKAEINVSLVYHGEFWKLEDLNRIEPILVERFFDATGRQLKINVLSKKIVPFRRQMPKRFKYNSIIDPKRLNRIWYAKRDESLAFSEAYYDYRKNELDSVLNKIDTILVITEAQFEASSSTFGQMAFTENPQEVGYGLPGGGRTEVRSDYAIVDSLIHELGHIINLGHTAEKCTETNLSYPDRVKCCNESPNGDDVMSYCRYRSKVDKSIMYGFKSCNQEIIANYAIPALLSGDKIKYDYKLKCN